MEPFKMKVRTKYCIQEVVNVIKYNAIEIIVNAIKLELVAVICVDATIV